MRKPFLSPGTVLFLALFIPTAVAAQAARSCNEEEARSEFSLAMKEIHVKDWQAAIAHLEKAANLCPIPPGKISVRTGFMKTPYTPFFFLGTCHSRRRELPVALRQFYLSSCFAEPNQGGEEIKALSSSTDTCFNDIRSPQRPTKHDDFAAGYRAAKEDKWEQSAEKMWDSMQIWAEDGQTTYSSGRWPEAYLPRFQLAKALNRLGCKPQACEQLAQSLLQELVARKDPRVAIESKEMRELKEVCTAANQVQQPQDEMTCLRWACWLREKGR